MTKKVSVTDTMASEYQAKRQIWDGFDEDAEFIEKRFTDEDLERIAQKRYSYKANAGKTEFNKVEDHGKWSRGNSDPRDD